MRPLARTLAVAGVAIGLAACGAPPCPAEPSAPAPPSPQAPPPGAVSAEIDAPLAPTAAARFAALRDRVLDEWLADQPQIGRTAGLHAYDGRVGATSASAIAERAARLGRTSAELAAVDRAGLSADDALDLALLRSAVDLARFRLVELDEPRTRPMFYEELFAVNGYLDRDYAPVAERARRLVAHEKAALAAVGDVRKNLAATLSKPVVETAVKVYRGYAEYLRGDVPKQLAGVGDAAFQADLAATNAALAREAEALAGWLAAERAPGGDASHVLGKDRFLRFVALQEGLAVSIDAFAKMGEDDLATNRRAFDALAKGGRGVGARPKAGELLGAAGDLVASAERFVAEKKLATLPPGAMARVKETPPFMRWNAAFLDAPGPFEDPSLASFYYLTLPDPSWPKKEQAEYLMPRGVLLSTTIHEVVPGHFLQGQWMRRAPTRAQKLLDSYSFVEGWAHYGEALMIEQGFGGGSVEARLGQLSDALLRDCRFVVAVGVHAQGMTLAEAERRFVDDCRQDRATAREQAVRATFDPGYFAYTLGKLQILALREEARRRLGERFSLGRFHDALLSHGAPPVPLVRERVLTEL